MNAWYDNECPPRRTYMDFWNNKGTVGMSLGNTVNGEHLCSHMRNMIGKPPSVFHFPHVPNLFLLKKSSRNKNKLIPGTGKENLIFRICSSTKGHNIKSNGAALNLFS